MEKNDGKKALAVGVVCILTYLANYFLRNILSVLTPSLLKVDGFSVEHISLLSSTYMIMYAAGQLVNGFLGDRVSPKKMVFVGIFSAGVVCAIFPFVPFAMVRVVLFALFGFALSMVRGPLMKIISENTKPNHARIICVFFSFASFAGPLVASLFAMINKWTWSFVAAGVASAVIACAAYGVFGVMESRGLLQYKTTKGQGFSSVLSVFKIEKFVFYMVIACLVEIGAAAISFWIPTLLADGMNFTKNAANIIFSAISVIRSLMPFAALFIFRLIKEKDIAMMRVSFSVSSAMFLCMLVADGRILRLVFLLLALMAMSCSSALLWSIYIPGLGKTGKVSSVNGVLDCTGYIAAAAANLLFGSVMANAGWNVVFLIWASLGVIGVVATFFAKNK